MALNTSGPISLAGCTVGQSIAKELGLSGTATISLNCTNVRTLLGVSSGAIAMTSAYGKSNETIGQTLYCAAGSYCFVVPAGVTRVSAVVVGAGGGGGFTNNQTIAGLVGTAPGGGALAYVNNVTVTPGTSMAVVVGAAGTPAFSSGFRGNCTGSGTTGGQSSVSYGGTTRAAANGGVGGSATSSSTSSGPGGTVATGQGGSGGRGGFSSDTTFATPGGQYKGQGGGGGAGGYSGAGGAGGDQLGQARCIYNLAKGQAGSGGGGGGGSGGNHETSGGGGGGVGLLGSGCSGAGGSGNRICKWDGRGGSGGTPGSGGPGGAFGGGGSNGSGARGGVRIIYPGCKRSFPSTRTANE